MKHVGKMAESLPPLVPRRRVKRGVAPAAAAPVAVHGCEGRRVVGSDGRGGGEGAEVGVAVAGRVAGVAHVEGGTAVDGVAVLSGLKRGQKDDRYDLR